MGVLPRFFIPTPPPRVPSHSPPGGVRRPSHPSLSQPDCPEGCEEGTVRVETTGRGAPITTGTAFTTRSRLAVGTEGPGTVSGGTATGPRRTRTPTCFRGGGGGGV